jgi:predicted nuclease of predicted toxin-antitoxin system
MNFLLDQSTDARLLVFLAQLGHDATRIGRDHPRGLPDQAILLIAQSERRILITDDRDFGELVFRLRQPHAGVIYLRLGSDADLATRIDRLRYVLVNFADQLDQFLVVTERTVRVRQGSQ